MRAIIFDIYDTLYDQVVPFKRTIDEVFHTSDGLRREVMCLIFRKYSDDMFDVTDNGRLDISGMRRLGI